MGIWHYPVKSYNSKQMVPASKTSVAQLIQPISNGSIVLAYDTLTTSDEWKRRVIRPANFKPRDDLYGNLGWDVISKAVTTISIAAYDDTEFWIDDVVLYGAKPSDFFLF